MTDVPIPPELVQDPFELNVPGFGFGRDPVRTPMPWTPDLMADSARADLGYPSMRTGTC